MRDEKIREALDAAAEYLQATTEAFRAPRVQHSKRRLAAALAAVSEIGTQISDKKIPLSRRLEKRFTAAQADGAGE